MIPSIVALHKSDKVLRTNQLILINCLIPGISVVFEVLEKLNESNTLYCNILYTSLYLKKKTKYFLVHY